MAENHVFTATIASNIHTEKCEAPTWDEAEAIFKSRLQPGETIITTTDKTLYPGGGEESG